MLVLKVPVQVVLAGLAPPSVPPLATRAQVCATAGSDKPRDNGTKAATSQNFRHFAATLDSTTSCRRQFPMARPLSRPLQDYTRVSESRVGATTVRLSILRACGKQTTICV